MIHIIIAKMWRFLMWPHIIWWTLVSKFFVSSSFIWGENSFSIDHIQTVPNWQYTDCVIQMFISHYCDNHRELWMIFSFLAFFTKWSNSTMNNDKDTIVQNGVTRSFISNLVQMQQQFTLLQNRLPTWDFRTLFTLLV